MVSWRPTRLPKTRHFGENIGPRPPVAELGLGQMKSGGRPRPPLTSHFALRTRNSELGTRTTSVGTPRSPPRCPAHHPVPPRLSRLLRLNRDARRLFHRPFVRQRPPL